MTVASMPMWSARVRSMLPLERPRQKLPPPTTMATSTPISTSSFTGLQMLSTVSKSMPWPALPARDSPLSFKSTRLYFATIENSPVLQIIFALIVHEKPRL